MSKSTSLSYYIRKMMSIERRVPQKEKIVWNIEWSQYQRKAAKLCSTGVANQAQKELVFRHV
jgi:hypothetical protein